MNKDYKKAKNELKSYYSHDVDDDTITQDFDNLLKWNDDTNTGATMDNAADTEATNSENNLAKVNVQVKFIQLPNNKLELE